MRRDSRVVRRERRIASVVPGFAPNAPKRNVIVSLTYGLSVLLLLNLF